MKKRTLVKPGAREQMKADLGTTQQNLVALLRLLCLVHPKRSDGAIVYPPPEIWSELCI